MSIEITSDNRQVVVNPERRAGKNFSLDITGGDHLLSIVNQERTTNCNVLKVSIK